LLPSVFAVVVFMAREGERGGSTQTQPSLSKWKKRDEKENKKQKTESGRNANLRTLPPHTHGRKKKKDKPLFQPFFFSFFFLFIFILSYFLQPRGSSYPP